MLYAPEFLADLDRTMSPARLSRYMTATHGDVSLALQLYEKNVALSEALFGLLHGLEVTVRNSIHHALSSDIGHQDWYEEGHSLPFPAVPQLLFSGAMKRMITEARNKAGARAPVGKVMAELTFGFWPNMLTSRYEELYRASLHKAFPAVPLPRAPIHLRLETIRFLRNRVAHHESVLTGRNEVYTGFKDRPTMPLSEILE